MLAAWATPAAKEAGGTPEQFLERKRKAKRNGADLGESLTSLSLQAQATRGTQSDGSPATKAKESPSSSDQLNPGMSRWLQGFRLAWDLAAIAARRKLIQRTRRKGSG